MEIDSSQGIHIDARKQIISQSAHQPTRQQKRETISPTKSHIIQEQKAPLQIVQWPLREKRAPKYLKDYVHKVR